MTQTVGDFVVSRLHAWGVRKMFGYPGDGINGVFGALQRAGGKIEFIQARHEEMAAFMASDRPVLLEVKTDPEVPPLPPHFTFKQIKNMAATLAKGDPNQAGVVRGTVRQVLSAVLPRTRE